MCSEGWTGADCMSKACKGCQRKMRGKQVRCNKGFMGEKCDKPAVLTTATTMEPATLTTKVMVSVNAPWVTRVACEKKDCPNGCSGMVFAKQLNVLARKVTLAKTQSTWLPN